MFVDLFAFIESLRHSLVPKLAKMFANHVIRRQDRGRQGLNVVEGKINEGIPSRHAKNSFEECVVIFSNFLCITGGLLIALIS